MKVTGDQLRADINDVCVWKGSWGHTWSDWRTTFPHADPLFYITFVLFGHSVWNCSVLENRCDTQITWVFLRNPDCLLFNTTVFIQHQIKEQSPQFALYKKLVGSDGVVTCCCPGEILIGSGSCASLTFLSSSFEISHLALASCFLFWIVTDSVQFKIRDHISTCPFTWKLRCLNSQLK